LADAVATRQLSSSSTAPAEARAFLTATLLSWEHRASLPEVHIILSELVTNAVKYAADGEIGMRLELRHDRSA